MPLVRRMEVEAPGFALVVHGVGQPLRDSRRTSRRGPRRDGPPSSQPAATQRHGCVAHFSMLPRTRFPWRDPVHLRQLSCFVVTESDAPGPYPAMCCRASGTRSRVAAFRQGGVEGFGDRLRARARSRRPLRWATGPRHQERHVWHMVHAVLAGCGHEERTVLALDEAHHADEAHVDSAGAAVTTEGVANVGTRGGGAE